MKSSFRFLGVTAALRAVSLAESPIVRSRNQRYVQGAMEIAYGGIQESPRYPAGLALRFARVTRYRPEKPAAQADTL